MTLLPCAHCGSAELQICGGAHRNDYAIECQTCWCTTGDEDTEEEAIAAWNRRADTAKLEQIKAKLIKGGARLPVNYLTMNAVECGMSIALALVEEQLRSKP